MNTPFLVKYQPNTLDDFIASDDLKEFIETSIMMDNLNLMLVGECSSGKTALLNIIIKLYYSDIELSPENYDKQILFVNSLKEQGINFYRTDVKTFCQTKSSVFGKKKIVILDDVDFINEQSQQVFRNCIDKYSDTVNFIITCINTQKVIESLQSRSTPIKLLPLTTDQIKPIIKGIIEKEEIEIEEEALDFILSISNNSIRLLINYLEKFKLLNRKITNELANKLCTNISYNTFIEYTQCCKSVRLADALTIIFDVYSCGYSVMDILDSYMNFVKRTDSISEDYKYKILPVICKFIAVIHSIHEDEIELAIFTNNIVNIFTETT
tara:strand:- start:130 stop:1104 length:975 start_codon:yes stop_codon:yes gene_type:complete